MNIKKNTTVFIAEDDEANRVFLEVIMKKAGYRVISATDGEKALDILMNHDVQLLILDIKLPVYDGFEIVTSVRSGNCLCSSDTPVIAATALAFERDRKKCLDKGFTVWIPKPFHADNMVKVVEELLFYS